MVPEGGNHGSVGTTPAKGLWDDTKTWITTGPSHRPVADKSACLLILPRVLANAAAWFCALQSIYTDLYRYGNEQIAGLRSSGRGGGGARYKNDC